MYSEKSTFAVLFEVLAKGERHQFKDVKKIIEKKVKAENKPFKREWALIDRYIKEFDSLPTDLNKAAVISGMNLFYLVFGDNHFEVLKDFTLKNLINKNGHIREVARHNASWLLISLSSRVDPFVYPKEKGMTQNQIEEQKVATTQYFSIVKEVGDMIDKYDDESDGSEYISQMKPSVHKSLQMFWSDLTDSRTYRRILEESSPVTFELWIKRKQIEAKINELLKQTNSIFDFEDVKESIYYEDGAGDMQEIITMFNTEKKNAPDIKDVLAIMSEAWNHFPHKILNGLCPKEMLDNYNS